MTMRAISSAQERPFAYFWELLARDQRVVASGFARVRHGAERPALSSGLHLSLRVVPLFAEPHPSGPQGAMNDA